MRSESCCLLDRKDVWIVLERLPALLLMTRRPAKPPLVETIVLVTGMYYGIV